MHTCMHAYVHAYVHATATLEHPDQHQPRKGVCSQGRRGGGLELGSVRGGEGGRRKKGGGVYTSADPIPR
jgi:hypothetical protein